MRQFTLVLETTKGAQTEKQEDITQRGFSNHSKDLIFLKINTFLINLENDTKRSQQHVLTRMYFEEHVVLSSWVFSTAKYFEVELSCRIICPACVLKEHCRRFQVLPPCLTESWGYKQMIWFKHLGLKPQKEMVAWLCLSSAFLSPKYRSLISPCLAAAHSESPWKPTVRILRHQDVPFWDSACWCLLENQLPLPSRKVEAEIQMSISPHSHPWTLGTPPWSIWVLFYLVFLPQRYWLWGESVLKFFVVIELSHGKFTVCWPRKWPSAWLHCLANVDRRAISQEPAHSIRCWSNSWLKDERDVSYLTGESSNNIAQWMCRWRLR